LRRYYLDLFSGIGGFALGAKWAGMNFDGHYFSEIDKYAVKVYKMRFHYAKNLGDIRYVRYGKLPKGEWFVTGGFPCQPHSVAGKKRADQDERDLWPECARMLRDLQPRAALFENVPGLLTSNGGRFSTEYYLTFPQAGMIRNGKLYRLRRSVRPISVKGFGSFVTKIRERGSGHYWRTPDANMERGNRSYENMKMRLETGKPLNLNDQLNAISIGLIPAPRAFDCTNAMPKEISETGKTIKPSAGKSDGISLNAYAKLFPTPTMQDYKHRGPNSIQQGLADVVRHPTPKKKENDFVLWPTPTTFDWNTVPKSRLENKGKGYKRNLKEAVQLWPTPRNNTGASTDKKHLSLDGAAKLFPTPDVRGFSNEGSLRMLKEKVNKDEFFGMAYRSSTSKKEKIWGTPTANDAKNTLSDSQRGRDTLTAHIVEAEDGGKGGQLNPDWVESLMGYPIGWTDVGKGEITNIDFFEAWLNGTWENGLPRITLGMKNRVRRLKCLGNAVVPEIPVFLIELIMKVLWQ
jgi:site-specific DNA-cytosine methylase